MHRTVARPRHGRTLAALPLLVAVVALAGLEPAEAGRRRGIPPYPPTLVFEIDTPTDGDFTNDGTVLVTGHTNYKNSQVHDVTVNGVSVKPLSGGNFSLVVPLDPNQVFNPIIAELDGKDGKFARRRVTLVVGDGVSSSYVADGVTSPDSLSMRIAEAGLQQFTPIVESLSGDSLDVGGLIAGQNPVVDDCITIFGGCAWFYQVHVSEVGFSSFGLDASPNPAGSLDADIIINDLYVEVDLNFQDLVAVDLTCGLEIETATATISGSLDLAPDATDPSFVDVNLTSPVSMSLSGFQSEFISGICDDPIIGDILNAILTPSSLESLVADGFASSLNDPDGAGPLDSPLADAVETALADVSIAGPAGEALGVVLDAPIDSITEDATGLTLLTDAGITVDVPDPSAPDLTHSYTVAETPPTFPATTPVGGLPYGIGIGLSSTMMNQLLKAQVESGLLRTDVTEIQLLGNPTPLTVGVLRLFIPELNPYDWSEPAVIEVRPKLAPVFSGNPGPNGELAELLMGALTIDIKVPGIPLDVATLEVDVQVGVDLSLTPEGALAFTLGTVTSNEIDITLIENPLDTNESAAITTLENVLPSFLPALAGALGELPIPEFLGLQLGILEVERLPGGFLSLFADLNQTPTTTLQNVVVTDLSSGDFRQSGGCWLREWRHRVSNQPSTTGIRANLRGMLGADAGCTTNDASSVATASYQVDFDVVGVAGEQWTLDLAHSILGAMTVYSDGYNDGIGFQDGGFSMSITPVTASWSIAGGGSGNFGFTPSNSSMSDGIGGSSNTHYQEFSGSNSTSIVGTGNASVTVTISFVLDAFSNSNTAFPTANGDEAGFRLGKNDTIDSDFTAGKYPGHANRNLFDDGHFLDIDLTVTPVP